jgi:hypothetical protein
MAAMVESPEFFSTRPTGIYCASGFIRFDATGTPTLEDHDRDHRCRHTLPGSWSQDAFAGIPANTLMGTLFFGTFKGDDDKDSKIDLLGEVFGSAALGYATKLRQPRAFIFWGKTAKNGKSQMLDVVRDLLPPSAVASVTAASMGDERHVVGLVGKQLNASDELSSSSAIATEIFKAVVTGEPVQGRDVYKSRVEFRSIGASSVGLASFFSIARSRRQNGSRVLAGALVKRTGAAREGCPRSHRGKRGGYNFQIYLPITIGVAPAPASQRVEEQLAEGAVIGNRLIGVTGGEELTYRQCRRLGNRDRRGGPRALEEQVEHCEQ